ncbi:basic proline-rich protein-like [Eriocheir sinensis]|uniref:basic proline-rich protein-like n=1 Tax=Eriocheir sinensis TaxID=95602 RepID=UPI0021C5D309|nr:basic proline-rich protein-like [Eriocheir sinensis]
MWPPPAARRPPLPPADESNLGGQPLLAVIGGGGVKVYPRRTAAAPRASLAGHGVRAAAARESVQMRAPGDPRSSPTGTVRPPSRPCGLLAGPLVPSAEARPPPRGHRRHLAPPRSPPSRVTQAVFHAHATSRGNTGFEHEPQSDGPLPAPAAAAAAPPPGWAPFTCRYSDHFPACSLAPRHPPPPRPVGKRRGACSSPWCSAGLLVPRRGPAEYLRSSPGVWAPQAPLSLLPRGGAAPSGVMTRSDTLRLLQEAAPWPISGPRSAAAPLRSGGLR